MIAKNSQFQLSVLLYFSLNITVNTRISAQLQISAPLRITASPKA